MYNIVCVLYYIILYLNIIFDIKIKNKIYRDTKIEEL